MTLLEVVLVRTALTVPALALLCTGRGRWERWARESAAEAGRPGVAPVPFPLAG